MDCSTNNFCASLDNDVRETLCAHCYRQVYRAGSIQFFRDFERHSILPLDGLIMSTIHNDENILCSPENATGFYLSLPGRLMNTNVTFHKRTDQHFGDNVMCCTTDSCVASFEHEVIRELFDTNPRFGWSVARSMIQIMMDSCTVASILRQSSVYLSVHHLINFLLPASIYLSRQQIAEALNRDRASVSKAVARVKEKTPDVWHRYAQNKGRKVIMLNPGADLSR